MSIVAASAPGLMTAEQLAELPDDGARHELIEGELTTMPPPGEQHGEVAMNVGVLVGHFVRQNHLGRIAAAETGFVLGRSPDTVRAPDFAFTSTERLVGPSNRKYSSIIPDLVVEVVSPSDRVGDVNRKARSWLDAGARLVWVVDPETEVVSVHRPGNVGSLLQGADATLSGEDVLPGFSVRLGDIFG